MMNTVYETYTGRRHYWVKMHNGTFEVREEGYSAYVEDAEPVVEFTGGYKDCVNYILERWYEDADYRMSN